MVNHTYDDDYEEEIVRNEKEHSTHPVRPLVPRLSREDMEQIASRVEKAAGVDFHVNLQSPPNQPLTIEIPSEVLQYREDIRRFVDAMLYKLKVHHRKGRWEGKTIDEYLPLLEGEVAELREACGGGNLIEILMEAADTANMAMIISAIAVERGK
jgi:NTP pyrophosphatase (non-canonical NTP hydrolase)